MMKICFFCNEKLREHQNSEFHFGFNVGYITLTCSSPPVPLRAPQLGLSIRGVIWILASCQTPPIFTNTETAIWGPRNLVVETKMLEKWLRGSQLLTLPTFYYAFIQTLDISGLWLTVSQISIKTFSCKTEPIQNSSVIKLISLKSPFCELCAQHTAHLGRVR